MFFEFSWHVFTFSDLSSIFRNSIFQIFAELSKITFCYVSHYKDSQNDKKSHIISYEEHKWGKAKTYIQKKDSATTATSFPKN